MSRVRLHSPEVLLEVHWARIMRHRLHPSDGGAAIDRTVLTLEMPDWVNVVAIDGDGAFVLVRQHRFGTDADSLEIPGGLIDPGESPIEAAARELREETGYEPGEMQSLGWCHPNPAIQGNRLHMFVARDCKPIGAQQLDELEDCRVERFSRSELEAAITRGEISHALALLAIRLAG